MTKHIPVLLHECIDALAIEADSVIVDATLGSGGHAAAIIERLHADGTYIGIDIDPIATHTAKERFKDAAPTTHFITGNFAELDSHLANLGLPLVNGVLADLGWRIEQFQGTGKGFSFLSDEPLLMTLGEPDQYLFTASDVVNDWDESDIANVIYAYGEERYARRIAKAIVSERARQPIKTGKQLGEIVATAVPKSAHYSKIHPATKTFQALRIAVNDELKKLETFIHQAFIHLAPQGRLAIISFHSLEDRIVKHSFRELKETDTATLITKKPIIPVREETTHNPRARSAKLRVIEKNA